VPPGRTGLACAAARSGGRKEADRVRPV